MGIFQWRLAGCKYVWRLIILEGTIATVHRLFVATVLDRFQRVDQRTGIETAQPGERLAEHLVGQCFQTVDTESWIWPASWLAYVSCFCDAPVPLAPLQWPLPLDATVIGGDVMNIHRNNAAAIKRRPATKRASE